MDERRVETDLSGNERRSLERRRQIRDISRRLEEGFIIVKGHGVDESRNLEAQPLTPAQVARRRLTLLILKNIEEGEPLNVQVVSEIRPLPKQATRMYGLSRRSY
jgi:hypothetical protein